MSTLNTNYHLLYFTLWNTYIIFFIFKMNVSALVIYSLAWHKKGILIMARRLFQ